MNQYTVKIMTINCSGERLIEINVFGENAIDAINGAIKSLKINYGNQIKDFCVVNHERID